MAVEKAETTGTRSILSILQRTPDPPICAGPFTPGFTSTANQLLEIDISAAIGAHLGAPGANYLSVLAYTTPSTPTDHIVGLRFSHTPTTPTGVATLGAKYFSGTQTAP